MYDGVNRKGKFYPTKLAFNFFFLSGRPNHGFPAISFILGVDELKQGFSHNYISLEIMAMSN